MSYQPHLVPVSEAAFYAVSTDAWIAAVAAVNTAIGASDATTSRVPMIAWERINVRRMMALGWDTETIAVEILLRRKWRECGA